MAKRLFVGNLPYTATASQLEDLFAKIGKVVQINLITDRFTGQSKGFAFVEMSTEEETQNAIKKLNNFELDDRRIVVNEARPQADRTNNRGSYSRPARRW